MNKKIVFFDIDGTLVDAQKVVPESTKKAIKILQYNGVIVALSTGRPPFLYEHIRKELNIDTYISFTGQHVVFEGKLIYSKPLEVRIVANLYKDAMKRNFPMM